MTMMDFVKEFDAVSMIFFNPNFVFNCVEVEMGNRVDMGNRIENSNNKRLKAIEIMSNTYSKENLCYMSVTYGSQVDS